MGIMGFGSARRFGGSAIAIGVLLAVAGCTAATDGQATTAGALEDDGIENLSRTFTTTDYAELDTADYLSTRLLEHGYVATVFHADEGQSIDYRAAGDELALSVMLFQAAAPMAAMGGFGGPMGGVGEGPIGFCPNGVDDCSYTTNYLAEADWLIAAAMGSRGEALQGAFVAPGDATYMMVVQAYLPDSQGHVELALELADAEPVSPGCPATGIPCFPECDEAGLPAEPPCRRGSFDPLTCVCEPID